MYKPFTGNLDLITNIVSDKGFILKPDSSILDFGCGSGRNVQELREHGYSAYGCDIGFKNEEKIETSLMIRKGHVRKIETSPYRLPFESSMFDFVFSNQVFEHVQNYNEGIAELARVLKPSGFTLHIFPSRYTPIEPHVYVPYSTLVQNYYWLYLWAALGIRKKEQEGLSNKRVAKENLDYLSNCTNYLPKKDVKFEFQKHFFELYFCEREYLKYGRRGKYIYRIAKYLPLVSHIYGTLRMRVLLATSPKKDTIV